MKYIEITFQVPEGYEDQIKDLVLKKIEGILSYEILKPTEEKKAELVLEVANSATLNAEAIKVVV